MTSSGIDTEWHQSAPVHTEVRDLTCDFVGVCGYPKFHTQGGKVRSLITRTFVKAWHKGSTLHGGTQSSLTGTAMTLELVLRRDVGVSQVCDQQLMYSSRKCCGVLAPMCY